MINFDTRIPLSKSTEGNLPKMKYLKWFKVGEPIPANAVYIKSETRKENFEYDDDGDVRRCNLVECFLYEVFK